jgi:hypothetical protein
VLEPKLGGARIGDIQESLDDPISKNPRCRITVLTTAQGLLPKQSHQSWTAYVPATDSAGAYSVYKDMFCGKTTESGIEGHHAPVS